MKKGGRISNEQDAYIRQNIGRMTISEIAGALNKSEQAIESYCKRKGISALTGEGDIIKEELMAEKFWPFICEQLTVDELEFFKDQYAAHIIQFNKASAVLFNEKMQIIHLIRNEILLDRVFKRQKEYLEENEELKAEIKKLAKANDQDAVAAKMRGLRDLINANNTNFSSFSREAKELQTKIGDLRKDLNANRAQRAAELKNLDTTFTNYIRGLDSQDILDKEGRFINIFRAAMELERRRLTEWHLYEDKEADIPLLTPENLKIVRAHDEKNTD